MRIFLKTSAKKKYYHLLALLESVQILKLPPEFHHRLNTGWRGVAADFAKSHVSQNRPDIVVFYLQPHQTEPGEIGFKSLADWVQQFKDPLSQKFSESLRRWAATPAGTADHRA